MNKLKEFLGQKKVRKMLIIVCMVLEFAFSFNCFYQGESIINNYRDNTSVVFEDGFYAGAYGISSIALLFMALDDIDRLMRLKAEKEQNAQL